MLFHQIRDAKAASLLDSLKEFGVINENSEVTMTKSELETWIDSIAAEQNGGDE